MSTKTETRRLLVLHYECEHTGDIQRNHDDLRTGGLTFRVIYEQVAHGPEVGASIIETAATNAQIAAAIEKGQCCIGGFRVGTRDDAQSWISEEESEHRSEYGDDE